jgi:peptidoglycan-associated lipoprotein
MKTSIFIATAASFGLLLAGCSTTPETQAPAKEAPTPQRIESKPATAVEVTKPTATDNVKTGVLAQRSIFYDYDKFDVRAEYRPMVEAHAKYLRDNPGRRMLIQGNADERGSREYNIGLGQRRSDGVKKMMTLLGVRDNQIESVSLGEEKPMDDGHNEAAWAKNRRSDILYSGEY